MTTVHTAGAEILHAAKHSPSREPLRDFVARIDLPTLVAQYAGPGKKSQGRWLFRCPNPSHPDANPSFVVAYGDSGRKWQAFCNSRCGKVGDALDFVKWVRGCDDSEAVAELRRFANEPLTFAPRRSTKPKAAQPAAVATLTETDAAASLDDPATLAAYLESRGWPEWVAERFGLRVIAGKYGEKRILHPFYAFAGEGDSLRVIQAGWQARAVGPAAKRWLGPPGVALPLYNLPALEADTVRAVVLCEGPADTITATVAAEAAGLEGVACVGVPGVQAWSTNAKAEWVKWLTGLRVIVAGDNDDAGQGFAKSVAEDLEGVAFGVSWLVPSPGDDLSEMLAQVGAAEVGALIGWHLEALEGVCRV